ncbi:adenylyl-sulfate kinase [Candidatus Methylospira mobilis]|uniref:Adenylyl-sulfate kinase n=1 Tax=Candidatus Methylospira mobilis TaxID=1808979 RepID=A0A5Q0BKW8_9GAMM|nr:adenylyl-sulfate kinase [Candidatus Methylospira mobilis]QFY44575.1 adenylyl-sulfate kinase [Candidatus Methylospira mobilis]WNV05990.1 adenylyl-sulfate kinase [Candidatus Methylospira mobilis]
MKENIVWHQPIISRQQRELQNGHRSFILWFTGLSGAGKSTLAHRVEEILFQNGCRTYVLDGDNVRHGLCSDLGFSPEQRKENIRRIGETAKLFMDAGVIVLTAFISPYRADRQMVRALAAGEFIEIFCNAPLRVCEQRDVKGLYLKARQGEIKEFTGISSAYEEPQNPELIIMTGEEDLNDCADRIIAYLHQRGVLPNIDFVI